MISSWLVLALFAQTSIVGGCIMLLNYTGSCHHKENEQFENFKTLSPTPSQNNWKKMEQGLLKACVDFVDTGV
jgi:hypothetical protein